MTKQTEAQRLATLIGHCVPRDSTSGAAAALLRRQDELLRQALEALGAYRRFIDDAHILEGQFHWLDGIDAPYDAIRTHLEAK